MTFCKSVLIDAPLSAVFAFHERDDALVLLSPPFPPVRVIRKTGGIAIGARVELRVGPISWNAVHTDYEKDRVFVDEQVAGPFASWVHRHEFEDIGVMTRLTDRVEYSLPGGPLLNALLRPVVTLVLTATFRHRHRVTKRICESLTPP